MAFSTRKNRIDNALADINITPFVDVVLVLLVIFMLTAHVMEFGVEVDVPKTKEVSETTKEMPVINLSSKNELFINDQPVSIGEMVKKLEPLLGRDRGAYLRCDKSVLWETATQVMAELGRANVKANVVTQPLEQAPRRR